MSKPKVYGYCDAGCKWETVHRSEVEEAKKYIDVNVSDDNVLTLKSDTTYRLEFISAANMGLYVWNVNDFKLTITGRYNLIQITSYNEILPNNQALMGLRYLYVRVSNVKFTPFNVNSGTTATLTFDVSYGLQEDLWTKTESHSLDCGTEVTCNIISITMSNVAKAQIYNPDGFVIEPHNVYIRYADDERGLNMTEVYSGQEYMGTYTGKEASESEDDYTWIRVVTDSGVSKTELEEIRNEIEFVDNKYSGYAHIVRLEVEQTVGDKLLDIIKAIYDRRDVHSTFYVDNYECRLRNAFSDYYFCDIIQFSGGTITQYVAGPYSLSGVLALEDITYETYNHEPYDDSELQEKVSSFPNFTLSEEVNEIYKAKEITIEELYNDTSIEPVIVKGVKLKNFKFTGNTDDYINGVPRITAFNTEVDTNYNIIKIPVKAGDVIRQKLAPYWYHSSIVTSLMWCGCCFSNIDSYQTYRLYGKQYSIVYSGDNANVDDYITNGIVADYDGYIILSIFTNYTGDKTYSNGLTAEVITVNQDASYTTYDNSVMADNYVPTTDAYHTSDNVHIEHYDNSINEINTTLGDIETILKEVVGGVE